MEENYQCLETLYGEFDEFYDSYSYFDTCFWEYELDHTNRDLTDENKNDWHDNHAYRVSLSKRYRLPRYLVV